MEKIKVSVTVIRVYSLEIEAENDKAALDEAREMDIAQVEEAGKLVTAETDYIELEDAEEKCTTCQMPVFQCQCNEG